VPARRYQREGVLVWLLPIDRGGAIRVKIANRQGKTTIQAAVQAIAGSLTDRDLPTQLSPPPIANDSHRGCKNLDRVLDIFLGTCDMINIVIAMGCRQVVRHLVLVQTFRGSNPCTPVRITVQLFQSEFDCVYSG
jgi:hypothetical protein